MSSMNWIFKNEVANVCIYGVHYSRSLTKKYSRSFNIFRTSEQTALISKSILLERLNDLSVNYWSQHLPCISTLPTVMLDRALSSCELKKFCANVSSYAICFSLTHPQTSLHLSKLFTTSFFFFNKPAIKVLSRVLFRFLTKIWIKV